DQQLQNSLLLKWPLPARKETLVKPGQDDDTKKALSLDTVMEKIKRQLYIELGSLPQPTTIAYNPKQFAITDPQTKADVKKRIAQIRKGLEKTFANGSLPQHLLTDDFRGL